MKGSKGEDTAALSDQARQAKTKVTGGGVAPDPQLGSEGHGPAHAAGGGSGRGDGRSTSQPSQPPSAVAGSQDEERVDVGEPDSQQQQQQAVAAPSTRPALPLFSSRVQQNPLAALNPK